MGPLMYVSLVLLILLGAILAYRGYTLMNRFLRSVGATILAIAGFFVGVLVGAILGGLIGSVILGAVFAVIGFIVGWLLAPAIIWIVLSIIVFILFWGLGWRFGGHFGASGAVLWVIAFVAGIMGAWVFSFVARKLIRAATSTMGGLMVAVGAFFILSEHMDFNTSMIISGTILVFVAVTGHLVQGKGRSKKKRKR